MRLRIRVLTILASLALAAAGCSDDPETVTDTGTDTTADVGTDTEGEDTSTDAEEAVFEDSTFRLTNVSIITPAGVGPILEGLINQDIEADKLHVLVQMTDFAGPWPTTFTLTGNAGQIADGGFTWYEGVAIDRAQAEIDAEGFFEGIETLSIIFPALEPNATEPIQIPVSSLDLSGELFEFEGMWVIEGRLSGAILASDIEGITVNLGQERALADLLGGEDKMDFPEGAAEGEFTGWRLEADISGDAVTFIAP